MRRVALALTIAVSGTGCSERPAAPAQAPSVPLSDVLNEIKREVAEYNREATAAPIVLNCNGHQTVSMRLTGVKAEVQSSLVNQMAEDAGPEVLPGTTPVLFDPSSAASAFVKNRQTITLNFEVPPMQRRAVLAANGTMPEHMNLLKALMAFRDQLGHVAGDGLCIKFNNQDPARVAFDFTAEEQEKNGTKLNILVLTQTPAAHISNERNIITVTFDMKGGTRGEGLAPARGPNVMPYFKESKQERREVRHQRHHNRHKSGTSAATLLP
jgi:hypothetical protein